MRMKRKEFDKGLLTVWLFHILFIDTYTDADEEEEVQADVVATVRELDDVLIKDVGDKIAGSGK